MAARRDNRPTFNAGVSYSAVWNVLGILSLLMWLMRLPLCDVSGDFCECGKGSETLRHISQ